MRSTSPTLWKGHAVNGIQGRRRRNCKVLESLNCSSMPKTNSLLAGLASQSWKISPNFRDWIFTWNSYVTMVHSTILVVVEMYKIYCSNLLYFHLPLSIDAVHFSRLWPLSVATPPVLFLLLQCAHVLILWSSSFCPLMPFSFEVLLQFQFSPKRWVGQKGTALYCLGLLHYCTSILISHAPSLLQKLQWQVPRLCFLLYMSILQHINYSPWENLSTVLQLIHLLC